jgi:hypothetical protein
MADSDTNEPTRITGSTTSGAERRARPALPPGAKAPAQKVVKAPEPDTEEPAAAVRISPTGAPGSRPKAPLRPAATLRPAVPPPIAVPQAPAEQIPPQDQFVFEAEDSVIMPEMPVEALAHPTHQVARERMRYLRSIGVRRTFIPILLTLGVMLLAASTVRYFVSDDAPLSALPKWSSLVGYIVGGMLLLVAGLNILQVRSELERIGTR